MRRWSSYLWREAILTSWKAIAPAFARPVPERWSNSDLTVAWLGHSTVLINFFGVTILTDPALFPRIGIRIPYLFTLGPKRLTAPALVSDQLPHIDIVLLSHAHFDHLDWRTLAHLGRRNRRPKVITAARTFDLLGWTRLTDIIEMEWNQSVTLTSDSTAHPPQEVEILALPVKHWGARMQHDDYRGFNGYLISRNGRRILFAGDTAFTDSFCELCETGPIDLAILPIGAYNPWIRSHCSPEQAAQIADDAGARYVMPVHHQTFRLSLEPFREPIERFEAALRNEPERIALREIGETFVLPPIC